MTGLRAADVALLGLRSERDDHHRLSLTVEPHLARTDGRLYGGAALAAALACAEAATGRPASWSTTQLIGAAPLGGRIDIEVDVVASGRTVDQVQVRGSSEGRPVFASVGANATPNPEGIGGTRLVMPRVSPPDDSEPWSFHHVLPPDMRAQVEAYRDTLAEGAGAEVDGGGSVRVGHLLVSDYRDATFVDPAHDVPGHMALWSRLSGEPAAHAPTMTPAAIGFLADMVPLAITRACGVTGVGTSLDNTLRLGAPADTEWILLELDAEVADGGLGHGRVLVWSSDGRLLAVGSQTARLFSMQAFVDRAMS